MDPQRMGHPQDQINRAYQLAWRSGSEGKLSCIELAEAVARQDIPMDLAEQAADDVLLEVVKKRQQAGRRTMWYGLIVFSAGLLITVLSLVIVDRIILIPVGLTFVGGAFALAGYVRSRRSRL